VLLIVAPWDVPELKIQERPPLTLRNINGGPLGGAGARDPEEPTINAQKHRWRAPREVLELEIQERPPSISKKRRRRTPWRVPEL
jgi:hypothetical protein